MMRKDGFTLIELVVTMAVLGILTSIAIPGFSRWLPDYRLKNAARDLYSNMQLAKMGAVRGNTTWRIVFDTGAGSYSIWSPGPNGNWDGYAGDDEQVKTVDLSSYQSGIGHGNAIKNATTSGGDLPDDDVSYNNNLAVFNSRGTGTGGYVYLENDKNTTTYAIGTRTSGVIRLLKWNSSIADWE